MNATAGHITVYQRIESLEDASPGWFLLIAALVELLFNRLFTSMGIYSNVGETGLLSYLSSIGVFAMNAVAVMGLMLACILLPKLSADPRLAPLPARILLMLTSPLYLPVVCVAIFRPISPELVLVAYLVAVGSVLYLAVLVALAKLPGSHRRLIISLGLVHLAAAAELLMSGYLREVASKAHLIAEGLFLVTPLFAFVFMFSSRLPGFLKRPHLPGLVFAVVMTSAACVLVYIALSGSPLALIIAGFRALGLTFAVPGGTPVYLVSLFIGAFVVGSLILPSKRWPTSRVSRRMGIGLTCIWTAGIQPTHPYQSILFVAGFLFVTRSLLHAVPKPRKKRQLSK
jgi:hypothetical protein